MKLDQQINDAIKEAMKAKDKDRLEPLRAAKTAFTLAKTDKGAGAELEDAEALKILQKLVKQRKETADIYTKENRSELADKELLEAKVLEGYLPEMLSEDEIIEALKGIIANVGASAPSDMGKVMGVASKQFAGQADNKLVSQLVRQLLTSS